MATPTTLAPTRDLREQLHHEVDAMARYAFATGMAVPASVADVIETYTPAPPEADAPLNRAELEPLVRAHGRLAKLVAPATPRSLIFLERESDVHWMKGLLGPVPLIRQMVMAALVSLAAFILLSLSPDVNADPETGNILGSSGHRLLLNELLYLAAAGIGASFAALFAANRYITNSTFDPKYVPSYWMRFALGIIAGIILALIIPVDESSLHGLGRPTLALLGGFSSTVVHRILTRLLGAVESLVKGEAEDMVAVRAQAARVEAEGVVAESRLKLAARLLGLQQRLSAGNDSAAIKTHLDALLEDLLPGDDEKPLLTAPPAEPMASSDGAAPSGAHALAAPPSPPAPTPLA